MGLFDNLINWFKPTPQPQPTPQPRDEEQVDETAAALLSLHNQARQARGLSPLKLEPRLMAAARSHAAWMAKRDRLSHTGFPSRLGDVDYDYSNCGENIAWNYPSAERCHAAWMNSAGHRRNILGNFTEVGFAYNNHYWCADYGKPATMAMQADESVAQDSDAGRDEIGDTSSLTIITESYVEGELGSDEIEQQSLPEEQQ